MTISTTNSRINHNGNGVTTDFSFPYRFLADADLVVILTNASGVDTVQTITTDYTLAGEGLDTGGTVTMLTPPAPGEVLTIYRDMTLTQEVDYIEGDSFPSTTHETALDRLTMIAQQQQDLLDRSFKLPDTFVASGESLTLPAPEADKVLLWNATGDAIINGPGVSDFATYVTNAETAEAHASAYAAAANASVTTVQDQKIVWTGAYNALTAYEVNDAFSYDGASYIVIATSTGNTPPNGTYYELLAAKGSPGAGTGDMLAANNLSDVANAVTAKSNLGMANVDNTSDAGKPVSTAQQTALDLKANISSPSLTGTPTAPTPIVSTNNTQVATTNFVRLALAAYASVPSTEYGDIGTYVIAASTAIPNNTNNVAQPGGIYSGNSLVGNNTNTNFGINAGGGSLVPVSQQASLGLTGSWRLMTRIGSDTNAAYRGVGLFLRIEV